MSEKPVKPTPRLTPQLTPKFVAQTLGTYLHGLYDDSSSSNSEESAELLTPFTFVTSDSRKVKPGCLFVALKGEKFDGHDYMETAVQGGATGVMCRSDRHASVFKSVKVFAVEDTLTAYRKLAAAWRDQFHETPVIGVAGSVGKTTTKELLYALLQGRFAKVLKTEGSQNGYIGIPMTLLDLTAEHGAAVIEIGIDEIGAMQQHMDLVRPDSSVLTAIGPEHLEKLINVETVASEEAIALTSVAVRGGTVIVNLSDPWISPMLPDLGTGRKVTYALAGAGDTGASLVGKLSEDGEWLTVKGQGLENVSFAMPLPGAHNAQNLLAAIAVATSLGLGEQELQAGLGQFKGAYGRSEVKQMKSGAPVLCDYYNANPTSVEAGLDVLTQLSKKGRPNPRARWACLGDMLELGTDEEKLHRGLSAKIAQLGIEHVLLFGPRMKALQQELSNGGGKFNGTVAHFDSHAALAQELLTKLGAEDAVMIKGSRGMRMEEVWKIVQATS